LLQLELKNIEAKLQNLENDLEMNAKIIQDIKGAVKDILVQEKGGEKVAVKMTNSDEDEKPAVMAAAAAAAETSVGFRVNKTMATVSRLDVGFAQAQPTHCDVEMNKVQHLSLYTAFQVRFWYSAVKI
jgi:ABC-type uncharacterized transport system substrate-binding protein